MAVVVLSYRWEGGDKASLHLDSDLESTAELLESATKLWHDTWGSVSPVVEEQ